MFHHLRRRRRRLSFVLANKHNTFVISTCPLLPLVARFGFPFFSFHLICAKASSYKICFVVYDFSFGCGVISWALSLCLSQCLFLVKCEHGELWLDTMI